MNQGDTTMRNDESELLTEAKMFQEHISRITKSHDGCYCDCCNIEILLLQLIDLVEKYRAIAIDSRAESIYLEEDIEHCLDDWQILQNKSDYINKARKEIAIEATKWHKIDNDEYNAIDNMIHAFSSDEWFKKDVEILRRLIEEQS